jgi:hypothetical protein
VFWRILKDLCRIQIRGGASSVWRQTFTCFIRTQFLHILRRNKYLFSFQLLENMLKRFLLTKQNLYILYFTLDIHAYSEAGRRLSTRFIIVSNFVSSRAPFETNSDFKRSKCRFMSRGRNDNVCELTEVTGGLETVGVPDL